MPLILISGYPCSGKTTRAQQLHAFLTTRLAASPAHSHMTCTLLTATTPRNIYLSASAEKTYRATEYSDIKRALSKSNIVIADGLNYIKGFRYQLFCEAKAAETPSCVVHVAAPPEKCREWNRGREEAERWEEEVLENLVFRFEEPNGNVRWDKPCFVVPWFDEVGEWEGVWEAMVGNPGVVKPNTATILKPAVEGDYLYELDKTTQEVVALIMDHNKNSAGGGGSLPVPDCTVDLELPERPLSLPQLNRMRRQFIQLNRTHAVARQRIRELFVEYINANQ